ncbi:sensor histidine kinase [Agromyces soli]
MTSPVRAVWTAPPASPAPPRRVWRDWVLVAAVPVLALVEAAMRPEVPWRWGWAAVLVALAPTLLWRRARPLTMLAIAFAVGTVTALAVGGDPQLFTTAYFLVLVYAVFRWGSGRAMLGGAALVVTGSVLSAVSTAPTAGDVLGGAAVAATTATLGLALRWRAASRARELERARLLEREDLARELHDTVAHHVSAIAVQAQAGALVVHDDPASAAEVLQTIEGEASRTLDEMRAMVRVLRRSEPSVSAPAAGLAPAPELAPAPGFGALRALADAGTGDGPGDGRVPAVVVAVAGDEASVPAAVAGTVFRIAREAVTNARRHARDASRIEIAVRIDADAVRLEVRDDGSPEASVAPGFGLAGMAERAALLGGTCTAGPASGGGWLVTAVLPRAGWSA